MRFPHYHYNYALGLILFMTTNFGRFLNSEFSGNNYFSYFAITCSIYSKKCYGFNISGYNF